MYPVWESTFFLWDAFLSIAEFDLFCLVFFVFFPQLAKQVYRMSALVMLLSMAMVG